jgi:hypothetical protein
MGTTGHPVRRFGWMRVKREEGDNEGPEASVLYDGR